MKHENKAMVAGKVVSVTPSHNLKNDQAYEVELLVVRKSGELDTVPVMVLEKLLGNIVEGEYLLIDGQVRTMNFYKKGKSHLKMFIFAYGAKRITRKECNAMPDKNIITYTGTVTKPAVYRQTNSGRHISELNLANNRSYYRSSYIPTIAWGINANVAKNYVVGDVLSIVGRFQSRKYVTSDGVHGIAFEISTQDITRLEN